MADVTDQTFQQQVLQGNIPVFVDFWAPSCGACKIDGPMVEELANEYAGRVDVYKLNVDDNPEVASRFGIMSIPTLMIFKNGTPAKTMIGAQSKENLKKGIDEVLAS